MGFDELSNTCLVLGLGFPSSTGEHRSKKPAAAMPTPQNLDQFWKISEPSLTLSLFGDTHEQVRAVRKVDFDNNKGGFNDDQSADMYRQDSTAASSFSNVSVKREREIGSSEEVDIQRVSCEDDDGFNERKKLRLTKIQSALLEESFKQQSSLNPKQKQELARELKLRPRQVEVWFQNRRARTKLKQTESDCEFLKKCCDTLTDENRRLQKELKELRALKLAQPLCMQLPAATLTMCPSCERNGGGGVPENAAKIPFTMAPKKLCYNPYNNPSEAC